LEDILVCLESITPRIAPEHPEDVSNVATGIARANQIGRHQRTRVDHRVVWPVVALIEDDRDRVELVARRLHPDPLEHTLAPMGLERHAVDEDLGYGLQREWRVVVAGAVDLSVHRREADREP